MENKLVVFVSSLIGELFEERKAVKEALDAIPLTKPWVFEYTPASADPLEFSYLDKVRECDIFILLLGKSISEPVRKEWQAATEADKPRLVFLKQTERDPETQEFINTIDVKWTQFASLEELRHKVQEAVIDELIKGYRRYRLQPKELGQLGEALERLQSGGVVGGDSIQVAISGDVSGQVAVGKESRPASAAPFTALCTPVLGTSRSGKPPTRRTEPAENTEYPPSGGFSLGSAQPAAKQANAQNPERMDGRSPRISQAPAGNSSQAKGQV